MSFKTYFYNNGWQVEPELQPFLWSVEDITTASVEEEMEWEQTITASREDREIEEMEWEEVPVASMGKGIARKELRMHSPTPPSPPNLFTTQPIHELQSSTANVASSSMMIFDQNMPPQEESQELRMVHAGIKIGCKFIILDVKHWTSKYLQQIPAHNIKQALWEAMQLWEERAAKASAEGKKRKLSPLHPIFRPARQKKRSERSNSL